MNRNFIQGYTYTYDVLKCKINIAANHMEVMHNICLHLSTYTRMFLNCKQHIIEIKIK